jgi:CxxC-x17-CxxC domain-containing protein
MRVQWGFRQVVTDDKNLVCRDCGQTFVFSQGEQEFFFRKGYTNEPGRCPTCRQARRSQTGGETTGTIIALKPREFFNVTCADCSAPTRVPFRPSQGRPVYCSDCYRLQQA